MADIRDEAERAVVAGNIALPWTSWRSRLVGTTSPVITASDAANLTRTVLEDGVRAWLLVVDNVEHPASIVDQLPATGERDQVIVTSRRGAARGWAGVGMDALPLGQLVDHDAVELLASLAGDDHDSTQLHRLAVEVLGGHALAITQVGAHIGTHTITIDEYLTRLDTASVAELFGSEYLGDDDRSVHDVYAATLQPRCIASHGVHGSTSFKVIACENQAQVFDAECALPAPKTCTDRRPLPGQRPCGRAMAGSLRRPAGQRSERTLRTASEACCLARHATAEVAEVRRCSQVWAASSRCMTSLRSSRAVEEAECGTGEVSASPPVYPKCQPRSTGRRRGHHQRN